MKGAVKSQKGREKSNADPNSNNWKICLHSPPTAPSSAGELYLCSLIATCLGPCMVMRNWSAGVLFK
jgi:hypothetical protein